MPKRKVDALSKSIAITFFVSSYRFLSNFYPIETGMYYEGIIYPTSEHAYQAAKFTGYYDRIAIAQLSIANEAKAKGKTAVLPPNWEQIKVPIMECILREKFSIPQLRERLINTGDVALIEGNDWHDNFWGNCFCPACITTHGVNMLGKLLTKLRTEIYINDYQRTLSTS